ncbi:MAG: dTDP-4-dehydrorhamnose reductase [Acidobacteriia bacterium]|nr:dTDP-4-dehydrorhamnose reductase [Terriglobia bacterium]
MTLRILLTGKNGQVGRELISSLRPLGEVVALAHAELDLTKPEEIRKIVREVRPQLIVNAAAYTAVDQAESDEAAARAVNADAPGVMAEEAKKIGAALVHYSTDYVFDGSKSTPYLETDPTNPINAYGRTKLAGEEAIRNSGAAHLIFRTAWVYGREGKNFLGTILRLATQREELRIVSDQTGSPTCSADIAQATAEALSRIYSQQDDNSAFSRVSGTYHLTAGGVTSWYEFTKAILEEAAGHAGDPWLAAATSGQPLIARSVVPIKAAEYPTSAKRPAYSVLSNDRLAHAFRFRLQDWRAQLQSCFAGKPAAIIQVEK